MSYVAWLTNQSENGSALIYVFMPNLSCRLRARDAFFRFLTATPGPEGFSDHVDALVARMNTLKDDAKGTRLFVGQAALLLQVREGLFVSLVGGSSSRRVLLG